MPKKNNRDRKILKPRLRIYCEGEKTEPNYLEGYINKKFPGNRLLKVVTIEPTKKNTPKQLVGEAISAKQDKTSPAGDIFWVVYDRESEQKYDKTLHAQAYDQANKNGIKIALFNVCFEVWILLHFQDTVAPYNSYDDLRKRSILQDQCKAKDMSNYDKGDKNIFNIIKANIGKARERAERMNQRTIESADRDWTKPYQWNPYTNIHELLDVIDEFGKEYIENSLPT